MTAPRSLLGLSDKKRPAKRSDPVVDSEVSISTRVSGLRFSGIVAFDGGEKTSRITLHVAPHAVLGVCAVDSEVNQ